MDSVSPETRSRIMARVRSKRNRSTEWRVRACLIRAGIRGWSVNPPDVSGKPDFVFPIPRVVVFVDGCFWHGCPKCRRIPGSNVEYWESKIERNRRRDRAVTEALRRDGWRVLRIWEHQLDSAASITRRVNRMLMRH